MLPGYRHDHIIPPIYYGNRLHCSPWPRQSGPSVLLYNPDGPRGLANLDPASTFLLCHNLGPAGTGILYGCLQCRLSNL